MQICVKVVGRGSTLWATPYVLCWRGGDQLGFRFALKTNAMAGDATVHSLESSESLLVMPSRAADPASKPRSSSFERPPSLELQLHRKRSSKIL